MSDTDAQVPLPDLNAADAPPIDDLAYNEDEQASRIAADLEAVFDVPVQVSAVLGRSKMDVGELLEARPRHRARTRPPRRRSHRHLRQQPPGGAWRSRAGGRQARRDHDGNHQGGTQLTILAIRAVNGANRRTGDKHAASHRWHIEGPAHDRHQDRDGQRRLGHPRRSDRTGDGRAARRQGRRPAAGRRRPRHPRPGDAAGSRAHPRADRRLRHLQRRPRRGRRDPRRRQGIHPAAARSGTDRRGARRRRQ